LAFALIAASCSSGGNAVEPRSDKAIGLDKGELHAVDYWRRQDGGKTREEYLLASVRSLGAYLDDWRKHRPDLYRCQVDLLEYDRFNPDCIVLLQEALK
jgi:hypothetical protein